MSLTVLGAGRLRIGISRRSAEHAAAQFVHGLPFFGTGAPLVSSGVGAALDATRLQPRTYPRQLA